MELASKRLTVWARNLIILLFFGLPLTTFAATPAASKTTINQQVSSNNADMQMLNQDEKQINAIEAKLNQAKRLTDSSLRYYRESLLAIVSQLNKRASVYKTKLSDAKKFAAEFSTDNSLGVKNGNDNTYKTVKIQYDEFYLEKIREFKQQIAFTQGRLLQIQLMLYKIDGLLKKISTLQVELYNGNIWVAGDKFYTGQVWVSAIKQLASYSVVLGKQFVDIGSDILHAIKQPKFWISLVLLIAVFFLYFKYLISFTKKKLSNITNNRIKASYLFLIDFIIKGAIPALIIIIIERSLLKFLGINETPLLANFIASLGNAIAAILLLSATMSALYQHMTNLAKKASGTVAKRWAYCLIFQIGIILFINNINFFTFSSDATPFYPSQSIAFINLILSFSFLINILCLFNRLNKALIKGKN